MEAYPRVHAAYRDQCRAIVTLDDIGLMLSEIERACNSPYDSGAHEENNVVMAALIRRLMVWTKCGEFSGRYSLLADLYFHARYLESIGKLEIPEPVMQMD